MIQWMSLCFYRWKFQPGFLLVDADDILFLATKQTDWDLWTHPPSHGRIYGR